MAVDKQAKDSEPAPVVIRGYTWIREVGDIKVRDSDRPLPSPRHWGNKRRAQQSRDK